MVVVLDGCAESDEELVDVRRFAEGRASTMRRRSRLRAIAGRPPNHAGATGTDGTIEKVTTVNEHGARSAPAAARVVRTAARSGGGR
jgi:hypothetical protein